MYLAAYHFNGEPDQLQAGYDRMISAFPPDAVLLNLCVTRSDGITVFDTCPSLADFESFSASDEFASALTAAGLPTPRIESLGDVHGLHGRSRP